MYSSPMEQTTIQLNQRRFHEEQKQKAKRPQAQPTRNARHQKPHKARHQIRVLLHRKQRYIVRTAQLATVIVHTMRRYAKNPQFGPSQVVTAVLATFDARCYSGDLPVGGHINAGQQLADVLSELNLTVDPRVESKAADALSTLLGQQCRVTGWLPGVQILDQGHVVSLTGDACPICNTNPVVFDKGHNRCLNREDCGWTARTRKGGSASRRARNKRQK